mmetsp:Transcript_3079/g.4620  ORF Transcript_3079/g.4620 Transcript_3079/m.4620 type:complete len:84 (-) Transcript_3079:436-687(-)
MRLAKLSVRQLNYFGGKIVDRSTAKIDRAKPITELHISSTSSSFQDGHVVHNSGNTMNGAVFDAVGPTVGKSTIKVKKLVILS